MSKRTKRKELENLVESLTDDILDMSDDEVRDEMAEEGVTKKEVDEKYEAVLVRAFQKAGRRRIQQARHDMNLEERGEGGLRDVSPREARTLIAQARMKYPELTQAARNAVSGELSDEDALRVFSQLEELGVEFETE